VNKRIAVKVLLIWSLWALVAAGAIAALPAAAQSAPAVAAPDEGTTKARALLDKMIAALGGDAFLNYTARSEQGRAYGFYHGRPNGSGTQFWFFWQAPDRDRTEFGKKRDVARVHNGDKGYEITYKGTSALGKDDMRDYLRSRNHSLNTVLRQWLHAPGTVLLYAGTGIADNRMTEQVTVLNAKDESVTIAMDATTYLPVRTSFTYRDPVDNLKSEETETFGNYRLEQGMMTAHTIVRAKNGEMMAERFLTRVEYNPQLSAALFNVSVTYKPAGHENENGNSAEGHGPQ
jgi:hypothetical protein